MTLRVTYRVQSWVRQVKQLTSVYNLKDAQNLSN